MKPRYLLAPGAALDLVQIVQYVETRADRTIASKVESAIRRKLAFLAAYPGVGHYRMI